MCESVTKGIFFGNLVIAQSSHLATWSHTKHSYAETLLLRQIVLWLRGHNYTKHSYANFSMTLYSSEKKLIYLHIVHSILHRTVYKSH